MNELLWVGMETFIDVSSYRAHMDPFPTPDCLGIERMRSLGEAVPRFRGGWSFLLYVHGPGVSSSLELLGELRGRGAIGCPPSPRLAGV